MEHKVILEVDVYRLLELANGVIVIKNKDILLAEIRYDARLKAVSTYATENLRDLPNEDFLLFNRMILIAENMLYLTNERRLQW